MFLKILKDLCFQRSVMGKVAKFHEEGGFARTLNRSKYIEQRKLNENIDFLPLLYRPVFTPIHRFTSPTSLFVVRTITQTLYFIFPCKLVNTYWPRVTFLNAGDLKKRSSTSRL